MKQIASAIRIIWKLLVFRLLIAGIVVIYMPYFIMSAHPASDLFFLNAFTVIGLLLIAAGTVIFLRSIWDFAYIGKSDNPNLIVAIGTYKLVRNPMYFSLVLLLFGETCIFQSQIMLGYTLGFWICVHLIVIFEERTLKNKFGLPYENYCENVPRWIPNLINQLSSK
jgi:protein-S-isoprenylcysteine O-methyltransferase Ste14